MTTPANENVNDNDNDHDNDDDDDANDNGNDKYQDNTITWRNFIEVTRLTKVISTSLYRSDHLTIDLKNDAYFVFIQGMRYSWTK